MASLDGGPPGHLKRPTTRWDANDHPRLRPTGDGEQARSLFWAGDAFGFESLGDAAESDAGVVHLKDALYNWCGFRVGFESPQMSPCSHRVPLPARDLQVEPDRTQDVQLHLHELARTPPRLLSHHHRAHLGDHHQERPHDPSRGRPKLLRNRREGQRHRTRSSASRSARVPRRLEPNDCAIRLSVSPNQIGHHLRAGPPRWGRRGRRRRAGS